MPSCPIIGMILIFPIAVSYWLNFYGKSLNILSGFTFYQLDLA